MARSRSSSFDIDGSQSRPPAMAMACRTLELTLLSASDLRGVNLVSKMEVYAVVYLAGDPRARQRVATDRAGGRNPSWKGKDATVRLAVPASGAGAARSRAPPRGARGLGGDRDVGRCSSAPGRPRRLRGRAHRRRGGVLPGPQGRLEQDHPRRAQPLLQARRRRPPWPRRGRRRRLQLQARRAGSRWLDDGVPGGGSGGVQAAPPPQPPLTATASCRRYRSRCRLWARWRAAACAPAGEAATGKNGVLQNMNAKLYSVLNKYINMWTYMRMNLIIWRRAKKVKLWNWSLQIAMVFSCLWTVEMQAIYSSLIETYILFSCSNWFLLGFFFFWKLGEMKASNMWTPSTLKRSVDLIFWWLKDGLIQWDGKLPVKWKFVMTLI